VDISKGKISLLSLDGELVTIPRYAVIFLVSYPIDRFPFRGQSEMGRTDFYEIKSLVDGKVQPFVRGWPIGFTQDKVSFMNTSGNEVIVDRENIWHVKKSSSGQIDFRGSSKTKANLRFGHPYSFRNCKIPGNKNANIVYPQDVNSNPITIKSIFDRIEMGHQRMDFYDREQDFYPVPQVFKNRTSLGLWQDFGGRHGSSSNRTSSLTPMLEDQHASDVFDYQQQFLSGSAVNQDSAHEEVQTLGLYRMKSSYFHFSAMLDPNLILVGQNYEWEAGDLDDVDDRLNDVSIIEMGLDFGHWSIRAIASHVVSVGLRYDEIFDVEAVNLAGSGLMYTQRRWRFDIKFLSGGLSLDDDASINMRLTRANLNFRLSDSLELQNSVILRDLEYETPDSDYESRSTTFASYIYYDWSYRWRVGGYVAGEQHTNSFNVLSGGDGGRSEFFPKAGLTTSLSF
ncbi:MAG: hypothetical protein AAF202_02370, partial [Pseudomonadota bacterium]